jgi:hypothetical protein
MSKVAVWPTNESEVPLLWRGDVLVVGGGSAGSAAAVAAARAGADTLLLESGGFLGGTGSRVLDTFYGFFAPGSGERVVGGVGWEVCRRLEQMGMSFQRANTYGAGTGVTYEPEALKLVWDQIVHDSGAKVLFYALALTPVLDGRTITGAIVATKAGLGRVEATVVIDASGDGELSWRAGAEFAPASRLSDLQPATATFRMGGVGDRPDTATLHRLTREAAEQGYALPRLEGSAHETLLPGVVHANMTRISGKDLTDPWQLTEAEQEGRRQVFEYARFLRERVPGYEDSYLLGSAPRLGIRETRRLQGAYVLDEQDFLGCARHEDDIALCGAPLEDHSAGSETRWQYVGGREAPDGALFGIPYRTLVPRGVTNLLVAGRFFSATHEAHASARSIGQCTAMGMAAGRAAAIAVQNQISPEKVDPTQLRGELSKEGALL